MKIPHPTKAAKGGRPCNRRPAPPAGYAKYILSTYLIFLTPNFYAPNLYAQEKDYQLTIMGEKICAKSHATCLQAQIAIIKGWFLPDLPPGTPSRCIPYPNCFSMQSNVIKNYNDK